MRCSELGGGSAAPLSCAAARGSRTAQLRRQHCCHIDWTHMTLGRTSAPSHTYISADLLPGAYCATGRPNEVLLPVVDYDEDDHLGGTCRHDAGVRREVLLQRWVTAHGMTSLWFRDVGDSSASRHCARLRCLLAGLTCSAACISWSAASGFCAPGQDGAPSVRGRLRQRPALSASLCCAMPIAQCVPITLCDRR